MTDYISREDAYPLAKRISDAVSSGNYYKAFFGMQILDWIDDIPAADVRPVVLCRDCKYFSEVMYKGSQFEYGYCDRWADGTLMNPEDFCSRGEKREES